MAEFFKRPANRFCIHIAGVGFVPVASDRDDKPVIVAGSPRRIGDDCLVSVEGQVRKARVLPSTGNPKRLWLVDMGPAPFRVRKPIPYVQIAARG